MEREHPVVGVQDRSGAIAHQRDKKRCSDQDGCLLMPEVSGAAPQKPVPGLAWLQDFPVGPSTLMKHVPGTTTWEKCAFAIWCKRMISRMLDDSVNKSQPLRFMHNQQNRQRSRPRHRLLISSIMSEYGVKMQSQLTYRIRMVTHATGLLLLALLRDKADIWNRHLGADGGAAAQGKWKKREI
ncbi:hypothetical protein VTJ04DRAFT_6421 [Mycothermus thermophilus]|uniref:uncharacterized protein n=1 Tax=Humicola insolens TaxID=85995 RepID=UPI00374340D6